MKPFRLQAGSSRFVYIGVLVYAKAILSIIYSWFWFEFPASLMARLNELPVSSESIEALKRRFIRQNREIARANATLSANIRRLETEKAQLILENFTLRAQIAHLETRPARQKARLVKEKLEAKLAELGALVSELGDGRQSKRRSSLPHNDLVEDQAPKRSPNQRNWKNASISSGAAGGENSRLPPILEDKYYPRKTLDAEELLGILSPPDNSADSPDLGPPPVAHFEEGERIKYDTITQVQESEAVTAFPVDTSFSNLETRKKRRESSYTREAHHLDSPNLNNISISQPSLNGILGQSLKSGAKRKLSIRDVEERNEAPVAAVTDGFLFSRRNEGSGDGQYDISKPERPSNDAGHGTRATQDRLGARISSSDKSSETIKNPPAARRALGEKSVNTDPVVSPTKPTRATLEDRLADLKKDKPKKPRDRERTRDKAPIPKVIRSTQEHAEPKHASIEPPSDSTKDRPKTPAQQDIALFPPISTEPSAPHPASRDTPTPTDLNPDPSLTTGRATRRPRGSVSYAEPNLRDKMRRPTKELVDAVGGDERGQRATSVKLDGEKDKDHDVVFDRMVEREKGRMRTVVIKKEDGTSESAAWKSLPQVEKESGRAEPVSPLGAKTTTGSVGALPSSIMTDRRKHPPALAETDDNADNPPQIPSSATISAPPFASGSATTIAALVASSTRRPSRTPNHDPPALEEPKQLDVPICNTNSKSQTALNVYDFHDSSPVEAGIAAASRDAKAPAGKNVKASRRYSSVPDALGKAETKGSRIAPSMPSKTATGRRATGAEDGAAVSVSASAATTVKEKENGKPGNDTISRAERAAGRRRSMML